MSRSTPQRQVHLADCCIELAHWAPNRPSKQKAYADISYYFLEHRFIRGKKIIVVDERGRPKSVWLYLSQLEHAVIRLAKYRPGVAQHFPHAVVFADGTIDFEACEAVANRLLLEFRDRRIFRTASGKTNAFGAVAARMHGTKWSNHAIKAFLIGPSRKGAAEPSIKMVAFELPRRKVQEDWEERTHASLPVDVPTSPSALDPADQMMVPLIVDQLVQRVLLDMSADARALLKALIVPDHPIEPKEAAKTTSPLRYGDFQPLIFNSTFAAILDSGDFREIHKVFNVSGIMREFSVSRACALGIRDRLLAFGQGIMQLPDEVARKVYPRVLAKLARLL